MVKKVAFLDRDGVINLDSGYVHKYENITYTPGIFKKCLELKDSGFELVVITNQSGIARGKYSEKDFHFLMSLILRDFEKKGCGILDYFFCPHLKGSKIPEYNKNCDCRKPKPGMIMAAAQKHNINLKKSILIGDKISDIEAGISIGIDRNFLLSNKRLVKDERVILVRCINEVRI